MPRKGRGGSRQGAPGVAHPRRTDLNEDRQPIRVSTGGAYGEAKASADAQRVAPLPQGSPTSAPRGGAGFGYTGPVPTPLNAPSQRSDEPITAGLPSGPGPGPEVLNLGGLTPLDKLKRIYRLTQNPDILNLILMADDASGV